MNYTDIKRIYFIGIGGIGMSALARYFLDQKITIAGYDRTPSDITRNLEKLGINISYEDTIISIPDEFKENSQQTLVVFTPAIPSDSKIFNFFKEKGVQLKKRAELLGIITKDKFTIAVAGTHGKTTTSWMIVHCLKTAGIECGALLGGISANYNSNYLRPGHNAKILVVEADEYDKSFLQLSPDIAVITSIEPDHLDIYGNIDELSKNFSLFTRKIKDNGLLILSEEIKLTDIKSGIEKQYYGLTADCEWQITDYRILKGNYYFGLKSRTHTIQNLRLGVPGLHNILNFLAATAVLNHITGFQSDVIAKASETFAGVKRRFEFIVKSPDIIYIDDYAHHPTELAAAITTAKKLYPDKKITGIFQPHLYTRTRDLAEEFAIVLSWLDEIILLDIYPAREKPIEGVNSSMLLEMIDNPNKMLVSKDYLLEIISDFKVGVLMTLGAGDIDRLVEPIKNILLKNE